MQIDVNPITDLPPGWCVYCGGADSTMEALTDDCLMAQYCDQCAEALMRGIARVLGYEVKKSGNCSPTANNRTRKANIGQHPRNAQETP